MDLGSHPFYMDKHTMTPWMKRLFIACAVVLGVQLFAPLSLQASVVANQQAEMVSLGTKDPSGKPGVHVDFDLAPVAVMLLVVPEWLGVSVSEQSGTEDTGVPLLHPTTGFHPSAP